MEARVQAAQASHGARVALKREQELRLAQRVLQTVREHEDLQGATVVSGWSWRLVAPLPHTVSSMDGVC